VGIRGKKAAEDAVQLYDRFARKPKVVPSDANSAKPLPSQASDVAAVAKPVSSDADAVGRTFEGLYQKQKDGSTLVAFGGVTLNIKSDGTVEGTIDAPDGTRLTGKGTFKDGKVEIEFEKIGAYSGNLQFKEGSSVKGADGSVVLSSVQQLKQAAPTPEPVPVPQPKPAEGPSAKGVQVGDTAYFGGFSVTFGKNGEVGVKLNSPDGREIQGFGSINDKGEITVTFRDPKGTFEGLTYSGTFSRSGEKDGASVEISNIQFLGRKATGDTDEAQDVAR